jgi:hypothetical protein
MGKSRRPSIAAELIGLGGKHSINPEILKAREAERARREAADTRTEAERWLGDPPADRSALANRGAALPRWLYRETKKLPKAWR